jgi:nucleoredoxin
MNQRRGKKDEFQIVWISRCRDVESYGQYFTEMPWIALPPQEAMGERGQWLGEKYSVKGIPTLVLLDDVGNVITKDARTMIPKDKAGIGFPWRNPLATLYMTVLPRSLRLMIKSQLGAVKDQLLKRIQTVLRPQAASAAA